MADNLIDRLSAGFRSSQILFTACELGIFNAIGKDSLTIGQICDQLKTSTRGTRILVEALAGLDLLEQDRGRFRNTALALQHLLPGSPEPKLAQMRHNARLYLRWSGLAEAVTQGSPVSSPDGAYPKREDRREFARAMADSAQVSARLTSEAIDLDGVRRLLDVGGGPGVFAAEFVRRQPDLEVTLLDDADTLEIAEERIRKLGLEQNIRFQPGDAFETELGNGYDLILISNVIHIYSSKANQTLVSRAARALVPGGRLLLKDFFLDSQRSGPLWSLLFAANMLVSTKEGDCYTEDEARGWFESAGLHQVQRIPLTEQTLILVARKGK
jgi:SAM-dependent methyltransferase